jgi:hypothetical protein
MKKVCNCIKQKKCCVCKNKANVIVEMPLISPAQKHALCNTCFEKEKRKTRFASVIELTDKLEELKTKMFLAQRQGELEIFYKLEKDYLAEVKKCKKK